MGVAQRLAARVADPARHEHASQIRGIGHKRLAAQLRGSYNGAYFRYNGKQAEPASPAIGTPSYEDADEARV